MNAITFSSFVKEAMALQTEDADTPPGYVATRAAVMAKIASESHLSHPAGPAHGYTLYRKNKPGFFGKMIGRKEKLEEDGVMIPTFVVHPQESTKTASQLKMGSTGRHLIELAGLGTLAAPSISSLASGGKKEWSEKNKHKSEVIGLGALAAPYAHDLAHKGSKTYRNAVGSIARRFRK